MKRLNSVTTEILQALEAHENSSMSRSAIINAVEVDSAPKGGIEYHIELALDAGLVKCVGSELRLTSAGHDALEKPTTENSNLEHWRKLGE